MLVTILIWPFFFVLGLLFGFFSPILAICKACRQETGKWQTYVQHSSAVSRGHQKRIKTLAGFVLGLECCQCGDEDNLRGKRVLLNYYKLGHHLGFSFHIIIVTLIKFALFNPYWTACIVSLEDLAQMDEDTNLGESLLRSGTNRSEAVSTKERRSKYGQMKLRDSGVDDPGTYQLEHVSRGDRQHHVIDSDANNMVKKVKKSSTTEEEDAPWGDWGPG